MIYFGIERLGKIYEINVEKFFKKALEKFQALALWGGATLLAFHLFQWVTR